MSIALGTKIRELRTVKKLTLRQVAEAIGVSAAFMSDLEHGRRNTDRLAALAAVLEVDITVLQELDDRSGDRIARLEARVSMLEQRILMGTWRA